jgi:hypothetical protein
MDDPDRPPELPGGGVPYPVQDLSDREDVAHTGPQANRPTGAEMRRPRSQVPGTRVTLEGVPEVGGRPE